MSSFWAYSAWRSTKLHNFSFKCGGKRQEWSNYKVFHPNKTVKSALILCTKKERKKDLTGSYAENWCICVIIIARGTFHGNIRFSTEKKPMRMAAYMNENYKIWLWSEVYRTLFIKYRFSFWKSFLSITSGHFRSFPVKTDANSVTSGAEQFTLWPLGCWF